MGVQQLQDIMGTVRTNLRAWLHILEPGTTNDVGGLMHAYGRLLTDTRLQRGK